MAETLSVSSSKTHPGPATIYRNDRQRPGATNSQYQFLGKVRLNSDLIINQDNYPNLNTGTTSRILSREPRIKRLPKKATAVSNSTTTTCQAKRLFKEQVVINQGGIRLISVNPFVNVSGTHRQLRRPIDARR